VKDVALIQQLIARGRSVRFAPVDVSPELVVAAALLGRTVLSPERIQPWVADVAVADDLCRWLARDLPMDEPRLFTFFSMLPNFMPGTILSRIAGWLRPQDRLLITANLVPGTDFAAGMSKILPQYDNAETRAWLFTVLEQGGIRPDDGELSFAEEPVAKAKDVWRVVARWRFTKAATLHVLADAFQYAAGDELELFFSCRHRLEQLEEHLKSAGLTTLETWLAPDGEEAICLCRVNGRSSDQPVA
jgi:uncharacterized SAM-dependent methyltransferase